MRHVKKAEPFVVGVLCTYEASAMVAHSPRVPPITHLARRLPKPVRVGLIVAGAVWLAHDFKVF